MIVSPDFPDTVYPAFDYEDGIVSLTIPVLEYYVIIILDFSDTTAVAENETLKPAALSLSVYPNPFNLAVRISVGASPANIEIFDINGRMVDELRIDDLGFKIEGQETSEQRSVIWMPDEFLGSGVYLIRAMVGDKVASQKVIYLK